MNFRAEKNTHFYFIVFGAKIQSETMLRIFKHFFDSIFCIQAILARKFKLAFLVKFSNTILADFESPPGFKKYR